MAFVTIKTLTVAAGLFSLAALSVAPAVAGSDDFNYPPQQKFESTKTRDQVRAEYFQAVQQGAIAKNDYEFAQPDRAFASTKTREEVTAEYLQAAKDGTLPPTREGDTIMTAKLPPSTLTREAVQAETAEWLRMSRGDTQMGSK